MNKIASIQLGPHGCMRPVPGETADAVGQFSCYNRMTYVFNCSTLSSAIISVMTSNLVTSVSNPDANSIFLVYTGPLRRFLVANDCLGPSSIPTGLRYGCASFNYNDALTLCNVAYCLLYYPTTMQSNEFVSEPHYINPDYDIISVLINGSANISAKGPMNINDIYTAINWYNKDRGFPIETPPSGFQVPKSIGYQKDRLDIQSNRNKKRKSNKHK